MKKIKKNLIIIIFTSICIIILGIIVSNMKFEEDKIGKEDEYQDYVPQEEINEGQYRETIVNLYFLNTENNELIAEARPIDVRELVNNPYKTLINMLIKGTESEKLKKVIPEGTILYDASIENGTVIINMSKEFLNYENNETIKNNIINSISKTLCELNEVKNISFLIEGKENKNLPNIYGII